MNSVLIGWQVWAFCCHVCVYACVQEKFCCDVVRIIQFNAELTEESLAYTSHVASASARAVFTKVY